MRRGLIYGLKKFWSEVFSGDLLILFFSIVLAVTSISSVGFLGDRLKSSMLMQASREFDDFELWREGVLLGRPAVVEMQEASMEAAKKLREMED